MMAKDFVLDILHVDFISNDNRKESIFKDLLNGLEKEYYSVTPNYEINFKTAYSNKRKYYKAIIDFESIKKFNHMIDILHVQSTEVHLKFLCSQIYHTYTNYLNSISKYISQNRLDASLYVNPNNGEKSDEAFIIHYLKANAIMLFLELQARFQSLLDEQPYSPEEIHEVFFQEDPPKESLVVPYSGSEIPKMKKFKTTSTKFTPIKGDLDERPENSKILTYDQIFVPSKTTQFAGLEADLNQNAIIDNNYNFIAKKGNKQLLAAFILKLKNHNFFNVRYFPKNKQIEDRQITKYFAHRYGEQSDTNKEFRNLKGPQNQKFQSLVRMHFWLDQIK
jgi:hypothetical protein